MEIGYQSKIVKDFLRLLATMRTQVLAEFPDVASLKELLLRIARHQTPRVISICDGLYFEAHGAGFMMWREPGPVIDVDISRGGVEIFDAWRILTFMRSIGIADEVSRQDVERGLLYLAELGEIVSVSPGWYKSPAGS